MGGALTYTFQNVQSALGQKTTQNTVTATGAPSTYIYEPWLATVSADINLSQSQTSITQPPTTATDGTGSAASTSENASTNVTGSVAIGLLNQSDYATEITVTRFDRSLQFGTESTDLTGTTARLVNRLSLPDDWAVQHRLTNDTSADSKGLAEESSELSVDVSKTWVEDTLRFGLDTRTSTYSGSDGGTGTSENTTFTLRHRSQPFETVTTDSTSNLRLSTYQQQGAQERNQVMQGVTTAIWRPKDLYDITVSGAFRTFSEDATVVRASETTSRKSQTAFGTLATSYVFQPRLVGNFGLNAGLADLESKSSNQASVATDSSGKAASPHTTSLSMGGNAGLDYVSEQSELVGFAHSWNTGVSGDLGYDSLAAATVNVATSLGHVFSRQFDFLWMDGVNISFSEGGALALNPDRGASVPVNHSGSISHSSRNGKQWDVWSASLSDNRQMMGTDSTSYNLANLQITQGFDPDRFSSIAISMNAQVYRQTSASSDSGLVDTVSGSISYRERMILGIENLNYSSDLSFNPPSVITSNRNRDINSASSSQTQLRTTEPKSTGFGSQRWNNRLDYTIGQVRASLMGRVNRDTEGMDTILTGQVSRRF